MSYPPRQLNPFAASKGAGSGPAGINVQTELKAAFAELQNGQVQASSARLDRLIRQHPRRADLQRAKGTIAFQLGDFSESQRWLLSALQLDPEHFETLVWLSTVNLRMGRLQEAESHALKLVRLQPNRPGSRLLIGNVLFAMEKYGEALPHVLRAVELDPTNAEALSLQGQLFTKMHSVSRGFEFLRKSIEARPTANAVKSLATLLLQESQPQAALEAIELLRKSTNDDPLNAMAAESLSQLGRFAEADAEWRLAEVCSADQNELVLRRASSDIAAGRFEHAHENLLAAIDRGCSLSDAFYLLSKTKKFSSEDSPLLDRVQSYLGTERNDGPGASKLNFALGKCFDDLGDYGLAMAHYDEANRIDYSLYPMRRSFDPEESRAFTDRQLRFFDNWEAVASRLRPRESGIPLFIVGMVRSGTTLTEQILSAHSQIKAGGERTFWTERAREFMRSTERSLEVNLAAVDRLADLYLDELNPGDPGILRVTDKNPTNHQLVPLLLGLFPKSKMLQLRRHPVDNLLSTWMIPFGASARCASNRRNLVEFYREHVRLTSRWLEMLPTDRFQVVHYEDLTSDPNQVIGSMLDFAGVEREDAGFQPETNTRSVLTPSAFQVRQPIHRNSQNRWKNYEPWLCEFAELL